ncbi:MAG: hypothetical protein ACFB21_13075 [Opitutales bacterium]
MLGGSQHCFRRFPSLAARCGQLFFVDKPGEYPGLRFFRRLIELLGRRFSIRRLGFLLGTAWSVGARLAARHFSRADHHLSALARA